MQRYLDAPRCRMIAEALTFSTRARHGEFTRAQLETLDQLESLFKTRSGPDAGVIVTYPGESE